MDFSRSDCRFALFFQTSFLGTICNVYLLVKFLRRKERPNGFQKICLVKTIPNIIVCSSFALWVVPTTSLSLKYDELPYRLNSLIGSLAGNWSYVLTPMLQVCMASNRFYVLYFPFGIKAVKRIHLTEISIGVSMLFVTFLSAFNIPEGCGYIFDPEYFQWHPEFAECSYASNITYVFLFSIILLTASSHSFNVATLLRLLTMKNRMTGINKDEAKRRRSRWLKMFTQSVIQDCLHLLDILNSVYFWKLRDEPWFQFLCLTLSFIVIYTLDGIVMLICHKDVHPAWFRRIMNKSGTASNSVHVT